MLQNMTQITEIVPWPEDGTIAAKHQSRKAIGPLWYLFTIVLMGLVSTTIPMILLMVHVNYVSKTGIVIPSGCHGPELPFAMLSGILMCIQLRFFMLDSEADANSERAHRSSLQR